MPADLCTHIIEKFACSKESNPCSKMRKVGVTPCAEHRADFRARDACADTNSKYQVDCILTDKCDVCSAEEIARLGGDSDEDRRRKKPNNLT